jgi:hypothetical protein
MPVDAWVCEAYQAQISQLCAALLQTVCVRSWQASRTVGDVGCRPGSQGNTASREPIDVRELTNARGESWAGRLCA